MGKQAEEALDLDYDHLADYLHTHHSAYMRVGSTTYYLTDANFRAWRAQDTGRLNAKGHYTDCSDLVPSMDEFLSLPFVGGKTIEDVFDQATFYASTEHVATHAH